MTSPRGEVRLGSGTMGRETRVLRIAVGSAWRERERAARPLARLASGSAAEQLAERRQIRQIHVAVGVGVEQTAQSAQRLGLGLLQLGPLAPEELGQAAGVELRPLLLPPERAENDGRQD